MKRTVELEVIPAARAYGMAFMPYSPLAGGMLGGKPTDNERGRRAFLPVSAAIDSFQALCDELGHPPGAVALAWVARQPGVTVPVIGPRTMAQLDDSLAALELTLEDAAWTRIDALFPGPGGPAPEAYAW